jgi:hypothetical protein
MSNDLVLLHQVHPLKLGADVSAEVISDALLWRHRLAAGLLVRFGLAIIGSSLVLSFAGVERLRSSPAGAYVLAHMPPEVILGTGTPFFPALKNRIGLKLLETRTFGSSVVYLRYETISPAA